MTAEDSNDGQLRGWAYRKLSILDYTLDEAELTTQCPLDNGRHSVQPRDLVGQLDSLPGELLDEILVSLDIQTLTTFRLVNHRAMSLVDSLHQYAAILNHCPDVIRAIISIHAESFSCQILYETLSTSRCHTCERFGAPLPNHLQACLSLLLHAAPPLLPRVGRPGEPVYQPGARGTREVASCS